MTTLENHTLTFEFPEVGAQLRSRIESYFAKLAATVTLPADRKVVLDQFVEWRKEKSLYWYFKKEASLGEVVEWAYSLSDADLRRTLDGIRDWEISRLDVRLEVSLQRTLRVPDDGKTYPLPAGLGTFPLHAVDDFPDTAPDSWKKRGGVLMPMYQSEALWLRFSTRHAFAVKIGAGKINAVSGEPWAAGLKKTPQDYVVTPEQPWLDGFAVDDGFIRQFVAMPLGAGYTVEEQLTGSGEAGGIQLQAFPMSADAFFKKRIAPELPQSLDEILARLIRNEWSPRLVEDAARNLRDTEMGLGAGGIMRQEIYADPHDLADWNQTQTSRCFVHLANSMIWRQITGVNPPHPPFTAVEYRQAHIPWFDYYRDDLKPLKGSKRFAAVKSVAELAVEKNSLPTTDNTSIDPELIVQYGNTRRPIELREHLETQEDFNAGADPS